ncbi:hypothetical protein AAAC51_07555 [Priestia megaterium]
MNIGEFSQTVLLNGTNSLHIFATGQTSLRYLGAFSKFVNASPGENYAASVYVMSRSLSYYDKGQARVEIEFYSETARLQYHSTAANLTETDVWQRISITSQAPEGTTKVRFRIYHPQNGDTFFSRPMLQKGNIITEWTGDGSYMTEDGIYTGELNASQITAGKVRADLIEIGSDTQFQEGYSPDELREEMKDRIPYTVEVISSNGNIFRRGEIQTTLSALVKNGAEYITDEIPASRFVWKRVSMDDEGDQIWDAAHIGKKEVVITKDDIYQRATFLCQVMDS